MKVSIGSSPFLLSLAATAAVSTSAFVPSQPLHQCKKTTPFSSTTTTALNIVQGEKEDVIAKIKRLVKEANAPTKDDTFDALVQDLFPGAIDNNALEEAVVSTLAKKGFKPSTTLLATSLCADELA
eukprot:scaffold11196_cov46-Cylindrotheca_fusiformis.AAC.1